MNDALSKFEREITRSQKDFKKSRKTINNKKPMNQNTNMGDDYNYNYYKPPQYNNLYSNDILLAVF